MNFSRSGLASLILTGCVSYTPVFTSADGAMYRLLNFDVGEINVSVVETSWARLALTILMKGDLGSD